MSPASKLEEEEEEDEEKGEEENDRESGRGFGSLKKNKLTISLSVLRLLFPSPIARYHGTAGRFPPQRAG